MKKCDLAHNSLQKPRKKTVASATVFGGSLNLGRKSVADER